MSRTRPLIIAHRGGSPRDVDNSPQAFAHAIQVGVDVLECDLRRTCDGQLILLHEAAIHVDRSRLVVADTPYVALKDALPWLLTFDEFLEEFGRRLPVNLDLKTHGYEREALAAVERHHRSAEMLFSSVHILSLRRLAAVRPGLSLGLSRGHLNSSVPLRAATIWLQWTLPWLLPSMLRAARANATMLQHRIVDRSLVERLHRDGFQVFCWTVDSNEEARRLAQAGVDGIASNDPARLLTALSVDALTQ